MSEPIMSLFRMAAAIAFGLSGTCICSQTMAEIAVPNINCDGDDGPKPSPIPPFGKKAIIPSFWAKKLAYYSYGFDTVLAPRGWVCIDTSRNGSTYMQLVVHPKGTKYPGLGVYSKWIVNKTIGDQGYIYNWASVYFPAFVPVEYEIEPGIFHKRDAPSNILKYSSDTIRYRSKFLLDYATPSSMQGIGLAILVDPTPGPLGSAPHYPIQAAPVRGFIAVGNSGDNFACSLYLYAQVLPPEYGQFGSFMADQNKSIVNSLIDSGQQC